MRQQPEIGLLLSVIPTEDNSKTEALIKSKIAFGLSTCESCSFRSQRTHLFYTGVYDLEVGLTDMEFESLSPQRRDL